MSGVDHVEVMLEENLNSSDLRFIKSLLKKYEIIVHAPFIDMTLISIHPEIREVTIKLYSKAFQTAKYLNSKLITFHGGKKLEYINKKLALDLLSKNLKIINRSCSPKTLFTIENLPPIGGVYDNFFSSIEELSFIKKNIPWVKFTLDIGHAFVSGEDLNNISKFLIKYGDSVLNIHLHDAILCKEDHLALGQGDLDLTRFLKVLKQINYKNYLTLETLDSKDTKTSWEKLLLASK